MHSECKGQGQEYILNAEDNPRIIAWALSLIENIVSATELEQKLRSSSSKYLVQTRD